LSPLQQLCNQSPSAINRPSLIFCLQDGLIEWNTLFLIARRQFPRFYRQLNFLCELSRLGAL
jgi:hypothetical protein